jgi:hypothetical protein
MMLEKRPFPMWQCRGHHITYWMCAAIRDPKFFFSGSGPGRGMSTQSQCPVQKEAMNGYTLLSVRIAAALQQLRHTQRYGYGKDAYH